VNGRVKPPLFKVSALLSSPEVVVQPPISEVTKFLSRLVRNLVECTRPFVRWMDGTCIETPEQRPNGEDEEPVIFTFYWDVAANPSVIKTMLTLNHSIQKTISGLNRYVESWRKHQTLWKQEKSAILEKFVAKGPSCAEFEEKLSKYTRTANDIWDSPKDKDVDFIRISSHSLVASVRDEALGWVVAIGGVMNDLDKIRLAELKGMIASRDEKLHAVPETLDDLKAVLNVIADIRSMAMQMEIDYTDLEERYRTRSLYNLKQDEDEVADAYSVRVRFKELLIEADRVDDSLEETKEKFTEITKGQVLAFIEVARSLKDELLSSGPGLPNIDLDEGVKLLKHFTALLEERNKTREELVLAEKLFDLPLTSYPELMEVYNVLKNLNEVYEVYIQHSEAIKSFSSMLWAELDIAKLIASTETFMVRLRKLKHLKHLPTYDLVEEKIKAFQDSLPLIENLKSDSLRKRHWEQLMEITGQRFDMDAKTFTLANLFSMHLHNFASEISEITNAAQKELVNESEIRKMAEVWKEQRFDLFKYIKGTEDRGYILRSTEEVNVLLEDMGLNMQSMMASRFVKPFLDEVRKWRRGFH